MRQGYFPDSSSSMLDFMLSKGTAPRITRTDFNWPLSNRPTRNVGVALTPRRSASPTSFRILAAYFPLSTH